MNYRSAKRRGIRSERNLEWNLGHRSGSSATTARQRRTGSRLFKPACNATVVRARTASGFTEAVRAVRAFGGRASRNGGPVLRATDRIAGGVHIGAISARFFRRWGGCGRRLLRTDFLFFGFRFDFRPRLFASDRDRLPARRVPTQGRPGGDAVLAEVQVQRPAPMSCVVRHPMAVDSDSRAARRSAADRSTGRRQRIATSVQVKGDRREIGLRRRDSGAGTAAERDHGRNDDREEGTARAPLMPTGRCTRE